MDTIQVDVKMQAKYIYDLLLFHTYSQLSGFLINVLGLAVIVLGGLMLGTDQIRLYQAFIYVLAGILFLSYTPFTLKQKAKKLMRSERYQEEIRYEFDQGGIHECFKNGLENTYAWDTVEKAIATPKDIAFYVGGTEALIVPKECFGTNFMPVMKLIVQNLTRDKIYIR